MVSITTEKSRNIIENTRKKTRKPQKQTTNFFQYPFFWKKLKCDSVADSESPHTNLTFLLTMPVLTRSQTRLQQERNDAYARFRAINARNTNAVGSWDKYRTAGEQVAFVLVNPHINVFLAEDRLFRRETYVKCYQLLQSPHCTTRIGNICMTLRSQIQDIGLYA
jgi:hypothetical protein